MLPDRTGKKCQELLRDLSEVSKGSHFLKNKDVNHIKGMQREDPYSDFRRFLKYFL